MKEATIQTLTGIRVCYALPDAVLTDLKALIEEEREDALLAAVHSICGWCAKGVQVECRDSVWEHPLQSPYEPHDWGYGLCMAGSIHNLLHSLPLPALCCDQCQRPGWGMAEGSTCFAPSTGGRVCRGVMRLEKAG